MQYFVVEVVRHHESEVPDFDTRVVLIERGLEHRPVDQRAVRMEDPIVDHQSDQPAVHIEEDELVPNPLDDDHQPVPAAPIRIQEPSPQSTGVFVLFNSSICHFLLILQSKRTMIQRRCVLRTTTRMFEYHPPLRFLFFHTMQLYYDVIRWLHL